MTSRSFVAFAQETASVDVQPHTPNPALQEAANQVAERAKKLGCKSESCLILILDFFTQKGATSVAGSQLAQDLGSLLVKPFSPGRVVDATTLKIFQAKEHIPAGYFEDADAVRWLGGQFHAALVLQTKLDFSKTPAVAKFVLYDASPRKREQDFKVELPALGFSPQALNPSEPYPPLASPTVDRNGIALFKVQPDTIAANRPQCSYMPAPAYTEVAREAKFSGIVTFQAIITLDNRLESMQIVKGVPYDLNQAALVIARRWRCTPSIVEGKAVPALVEFETSFRLY